MSLKRIVALIAMVALGLSSTPSLTAEPQIGKPFSLSFAVPDQAGKPQSLQSLMGTKGVALFFVRSADWCPFCKGQLVDINRHLEQFRAQGLNVVAVSVDEAAVLGQFAKEQKIGYTLLADPKGNINLALGIRDEQYPLGTKAFGVPKPTLYVLDKQHKVRLRYQEKTFRTRPDLAAVLNDIKALKL